MVNKLLLIISFVAVLSLSACGWNDTHKGDTTEPGTMATNNLEGTDKEVGENMDGKSHSDATHSTWGELPEGIKEAENPKFPVGSTVRIKANHHSGMQEAVGKVVGAYDTIAYSVSYTPTTGDPYEENHKWLVQEEIQDYGEEALEQGAEVIINAEHKEGMKGAQGEIDTVQDTTVYMVDYTTTDDEAVINYKWLIESELEAQ